MTYHEPGLSEPDTPDRGGTTLVVHHPAPGIAYVRGEVVIDPNDRLRLSDLLVVTEPDRYVDVALWRSVPIARIESVLNDPHNHELVLDSVRSGKRTGIEWGDLDYLYRDRRKAPLRIAVPDGRSYPDGFYRKVADAYARLVDEGRPPGQTLASVNGVPESTVARWVREARRRRLLAPAAAQGRIG